MSEDFASYLRKEFGNDVVIAYGDDQGSISRMFLQMHYGEWVARLSDWKTFLTLTFNYNVSEESADKAWRNLVRMLNRDLIGRHYTRYVKHSYFGYVKVLETTKADRYHIHALIDRPVNYSLIHDVWNQYSGFAKTEIINDLSRATNYLCKYVMKEQDFQVYIPDKIWQPKVKPWWWNDKSNENAIDE